MKIIKPSIEVIDWGFCQGYEKKSETLSDVVISKVIGDITGIEILKKIERIGRVCYKSEEKIIEDSYITFIQNLLKRGHEAVLEHHSISVRIICDRGVTHELVRHRLAAYCQESTRYCNYGNKEIEFIEPCFFTFKEPVIKTNEGDIEIDLSRLIWEKAMKDSEEAYRAMINNGSTPQEARSVLPNSLKTEIVITANLREWRHILKLRTAQSAHPQMREVMLMILEEFKKTIPIIFDEII
jgi:thymidylate synthase (FAD)